MKDTSRFWMGGIVGLAENSTVQYCANTGDMTSWTPCTGGIVGQLIQNSKVINCYSTGKMAPLGNGTTDFGGIAGIVGAGTEIRHCYFAGEVDISQYHAATPYKRLGGIAGNISSGTPVFENNYFVETGNVTACFKYPDAGTKKTLEYMKTEDFCKEINAAGGNYRLNSDGFPALPAPKYAVSFVATPAGLTNVVIKVNGQEAANPVDLEAGTYTVEVSADKCEVFRSDITITADTASHTQTVAMTYLPADYTKVEAAIAKAKALKKDNYKDFSAVETAVGAVVRGKNITEQSKVDTMAKAIEDALAALQYKDADYTKVDAAIAKAKALKKDEYKDFTAVETAVGAVVRGKNITEQAEVDAMAKAIEDAIAALQYKDAASTPQPTPSSTPTPTKTPAPDNTAAPVQTPAPVSAAAPVQTPAPSRTSAPTKTPAPTKSAAPTATPAAESTATPTPTPTPAPTATPSPTPSPTPAPQDTVPQESHTSSPALWIILILVIGGAVFVIVVFGKKKKRNR